MAGQVTQPWEPGDDLEADRLEVMRQLSESAQLSAHGKNVHLLKGSQGGTAITVDEPQLPAQPFLIRLIAEDPSTPAHFSWIEVYPSLSVSGAWASGGRNSLSDSYIYSAVPTNGTGGIHQSPFHVYPARLYPTSTPGQTVAVFECEDNYVGLFYVTAKTASGSNRYAYSMTRCFPDDDRGATIGYASPFAPDVTSPITITAYNYREMANGASGRLGVGSNTTDLQAGQVLGPAPVSTAPIRVYRHWYGGGMDYWFDFYGGSTATP